MNLINLKILTPEGIYLEQGVYRIDIKTQSGNIGVLKGHVPMVSSIDIGKLQIINSKNQIAAYALHGGLLNVTGQEVIIITDAIEFNEEIDRKRAGKAKSEAEKLLVQLNDTDKDYHPAELALKRAITRLKL